MADQNAAQCGQEKKKNKVEGENTKPRVRSAPDGSDNDYYGDDNHDGDDDAGGVDDDYGGVDDNISGLKQWSLMSFQLPPFCPGAL